jgi:hypothetical protein
MLHGRRNQAVSDEVVAHVLESCPDIRVADFRVIPINVLFHVDHVFAAFRYNR